MGSDAGHIVTDHIKVISIHAPRMGSDCTRCAGAASLWHFYPRPPHGERQDGQNSAGVYTISIHAPRMGSDVPVQVLLRQQKDFYPRPPHGERQQTWRKKCPVCVCLLCKVRKHPNNSLKSRGLSPKFASPYIKLSKNLCILRCEPPGKIMSDHGSHYSPEESAF